MFLTDKTDDNARLDAPYIYALDTNNVTIKYSVTTASAASYTQLR
jgi:hypothetical protein